MWTADAPWSGFHFTCLVVRGDLSSVLNVSVDHTLDKPVSFPYGNDERNQWRKQELTLNLWEKHACIGEGVGGTDMSVCDMTEGL